MKRQELSEAQWNTVKDLLPPEKSPKGGRPAKSSREMLNAIDILTKHWYSVARSA